MTMTVSVIVEPSQLRLSHRLVKNRVRWPTTKSSTPASNGVLDGRSVRMAPTVSEDVDVDGTVGVDPPVDAVLAAVGRNEQTVVHDDFPARLVSPCPAANRSASASASQVVVLPVLTTRAVRASDASGRSSTSASSRAASAVTGSPATTARSAATTDRYCDASITTASRPVPSSITEPSRARAAGTPDSSTSSSCIVDVAAGVAATTSP